MKVVQFIIIIMVIAGTSTFANSMIYNYKIGEINEVDVGKFIEDFSVIDLTNQEIEEINRKKAEEELETHKENERERIKTLVSRGTRKSVPKSNTSMKSYMDYRKITSKSSAQYQLQQLDEIYTDEEGFRKIGYKFIVAVGTHYTSNVGDNLIVELAGGRTFEAIVGDIKNNKHTDSTNRQHNTDGSIIEFIVDTKVLAPMIKRMGDCSYAKIANLDGNVTSIVVTDEQYIIIK